MTCLLLLVLVSIAMTNSFTHSFVFISDKTCQSSANFVKICLET